MLRLASRSRIAFGQLLHGITAGVLHAPNDARVPNEKQERPSSALRAPSPHAKDAWGEGKAVRASAG